MHGEMKDKNNVCGQMKCPENNNDIWGSKTTRDGISGKSRARGSTLLFKPQPQQR